MATEDVVEELAVRLTEERAELDRLDAYFRTGTYDALGVALRKHPTLDRLIRQGVTNWLRLVVETTAERLIVDGFRRPDEETNDGVLWEWWQANRLDGRQMPHYVETLKNGYGYVSVWPGDEDGDAPKISPESSYGLTVLYDGDDPHEPTAAFKIRGSKAWVYLPSMVVPFEYDASARSRWRALEAIENPLGVVPFVKFRANPTVDGGHASDLDVAIPIQDRINSTTIDRLLAAWTSAFPQRWATGLVLEVDEETGKAKPPFSAASNSLWIADEPDVKFGSFPEASLSNYIGAIESDVRHLAAVTRTPPHYLLGEMVNLSAEALVAAETGLSRKVAERQMTFGESWEEVLRLAALAAGNEELAADVRLETIWRRTETVSDAQIVDAATKLVALDVPRRVLWEKIGATPQEVTRWEAIATREALRAALASPISNEGAIGSDAENDPENEQEAA